MGLMKIRQNGRYSKVSKTNKYLTAIKILEQGLEVTQGLLKDKGSLGKIGGMVPSSITNKAIEKNIKQIRDAIDLLTTEGNKDE